MDATAAFVRTLVEDVTGEPLVSVDHLPYGHQSVSFDVTLHDGTALIVRTNADRDVFRATLHNLAILRGLGLPVPRVLFHDLDQSRFPFADLVLERFPGRDLGYQLPSMTLSQMEAVADAVLDAQ